MVPDVASGRLWPSAISTSWQLDSIPHEVRAVPGCGEIRPYQRVSIGRDPIQGPLIHRASDPSLAEDRVSIDEPQTGGLTLAIGTLGIRIDPLAIELGPVRPRLEREHRLVVVHRRRIRIEDRVSDAA